MESDWRWNVALWGWSGLGYNQLCGSERAHYAAVLNPPVTTGAGVCTHILGFYPNQAFTQVALGILLDGYFKPLLRTVRGPHAHFPFGFGVLPD